MHNSKNKEKKRVERKRKRNYMRESKNERKKENCIRIERKKKQQIV